MTPLTFFDSTLGCLSHSHGMAAAVLTTALSMLPKALARLAGSAMRSPLSIIALILGSSSWGQFALFDEEIERPSNGTLNIVNGSLESLTHPTLGQTWTFFPGTPQKLVYMVSWDTSRKLTLNPSDRSCWRTICAVLSSGASLSPTMRIFGAVAGSKCAFFR